MYKKYLKDTPLTFPEIPLNIDYNYSYFPVIFPDESLMLKIKTILATSNINTRRYFYPSLNRLPYITSDSCLVSENISSRVLCLPLYPQLESENVKMISDIISLNI